MMKKNVTCCAAFNNLFSFAWNKSHTIMKRILLNLLCLCFALTLSAQVSKTVTISAGGLSSALTASEKSTVTNLTINGTIDARDFKTMRDELTVLSVLTMSGASVGGYTGTGGTVSSQSVVYPADAIPIYAFCNTDFIGKKSLTSVTLPAGIKLIDMRSFWGCSGISSITNLSTSLTEIGSGAFYSCGNALTITIPSSVTTLRSMAFEAFNGTLVVDGSNPNYSSWDGAIFNKDKTTLLFCPASKSSFTIPLSVNTLGYGAFSHCMNLTGAFYIPFGVKEIGSSAFRNCEKLASIVIPSSVDTIGNGAFSECRILQSLTVHCSVPPLFDTGTLAFHLIDKKKCILYVPKGSLLLYLAANGWKDFENITEIPVVSSFPYTEDFSYGQVYSWNIIDNVGEGQVWGLQNLRNREIYTPSSSNGFMIIDSDCFGSGKTQNTDLISPTFNFLDKTLIQISFYHYYRHYQSSEAKFFYSIDNGITWVEKDRWVSEISNSIRSNYDLTSELAGQTTVKFKWNYVGTWAWYWAIDDFEVKANAPLQANLTIQNVSVENSTNVCYNAENQITLAGNSTTVDFVSGSTVDLIAGQSIRFLPGFHAHNGSQVHAWITTDGSFCDQSPAPIMAQSIDKSSFIEGQSESNGISGEDHFVKLYPNPNNGMFTVELKNYDSATVEIYSLSGAKMLHISNVESGVFPLNIGIQKGIYFLKVCEGGSQKIKKFIVQ